MTAFFIGRILFMAPKALVVTQSTDAYQWPSSTITRLLMTPSTLAFQCQYHN